MDVAPEPDDVNGGSGTVIGRAARPFTYKVHGCVDPYGKPKGEPLPSDNSAISFSVEEFSYSTTALSLLRDSCSLVVHLPISGTWFGI